jgi:glycopeptide antibiotics resistance protein
MTPAISSEAIPVLVSRLRSMWALALAALATSLGVEAIQYLGTVTGFMNRSVDIDDLILNVLGALLGWGIWKVVALAFAARRKGESEEESPV